jgi:hypothetical protein
MKKFVLTILALVALAVPAAAQTGDISAYSDQAGTSCNIGDPGGGVVNVHLIHKHTSGATASQFAMTSVGNMTMGVLNFTPQADVLMLGSPADLSLAYTGCRVGDFYLGSLLYLSNGTSSPCSRITFGPAPTQIVLPGEVVMIDCANNFVVVPFGQGIVEADGTCQCNVGVSQTTWGGIKAMYR